MYRKSVNFVKAAGGRLVRLIRGNKPVARIHSSAVLHPGARLSNPSGCFDNISVGAFTHIRGDLILFGHGGRIQIGDHCYVGEQTRIWSGAEIVIGDRVLIAHLVTIMDNLTHPLGAAERHAHYRSIISEGHPRDLDLGDRPVKIEDDAWIGCNCVILRGVTIGTGAIVAAGSVVTRDVPAWTLVAGNPAKPIRQLREDER